MESITDWMKKDARRMREKALAMRQKAEQMKENAQRMQKTLEQINEIRGLEIRSPLEQRALRQRASSGGCCDQNSASMAPLNSPQRNPIG
jgi:hypothetical protein